MGEAQDYSTHCPVCGGLAYMHTWLNVQGDIEIDYMCRGCGKEFIV